MPDSFDLTVIVPTFNRCEALERLMEGLARQDATNTSFEVLIVDNNSTDTTGAVVQRLVDRFRALSIQYLFEPRRGVSYARNAGAKRARAPLLAFVDDDVVPEPTWVSSIMRAFAEHPGIDGIGGRIRPVWRDPPPAWLTAQHVGPIAVRDSAEPMHVNRDNASPCLMTANFACRRAALETIGGFSGDYLRCQDRELQMRMWRAGMQGLYLPQIEVTVEIPASRLRKVYHRRWRVTTGRYHARMRYPDLIDRTGRLLEEPVHHRTLFGSPSFVYRESLGHLVGWCRALVTGRAADCFFHETRLWYWASFVWTRMADSRRRQATAPLPPAGRPSQEGTAV